MKTILVLGAGRVSAPCVEYLMRKTDFKVVVSDVSVANLAAVEKICPSAEFHVADASREASAILDKHNPAVVINLLPPELMLPVSKLCLEKRVHMIHPAYIDAETRSLDAAVRTAGLVFIPELGLDPGIDHMSATKLIREIKRDGAKVTGFRSICGALPSADANTNPWGYKLSWSPASLIGASKRTAKVIKDGQVLVWPDGETYRHAYLDEIDPLGTFEVYANADSTPYKEIYDIPDVVDLYRGTLRYPGWSEIICWLNELNYFDTNETDLTGLTFASFTAGLAGAESKPRDALMRMLNIKPWSTFLLRMEWLGFFDDRPIPISRGSARDVLAQLFAEKLLFTEGERDLIILRDECRAEFPDGSEKLYRSTLIDYGIPGGISSIARTTGLPPAIAARLILEGIISTAGIRLPVEPEIVDAVLSELASEGIKLEESVLSV